MAMATRLVPFLFLCLACLAVFVEAQDPYWGTLPKAETVLKMHNDARSRHGAGPLKWSTTLMRQAQDWADLCIWEHAPSVIRRGMGENLYFNWGFSAQVSGPRAVENWYQEINDYDWFNPAYATSPGKDIGHFTQMIWKESRRIGCAYKKCDRMFGLEQYTGLNYVVCRYDPPGNVVAEYDRGEEYVPNVLPLRQGRSGWRLKISDYGIGGSTTTGSKNSGGKNPGGKQQQGQGNTANKPKPGSSNTPNKGKPSNSGRSREQLKKLRESISMMLLLRVLGHDDK